MVKTMKYQIIKPMDTSWQEFGKLLFELMKDTREVKNKTIQLSWEYYNFSSDYLKNHGKRPEPKEVLKYSGVHGYANNKLKTVSGWNMNKGNLSVSIMSAVKNWKSSLKEVLKGERSISSYKKDQPIDLANKNYKVIKEDGDYFLNLSLVSDEKKYEMGRKSGQFLVMINKGKNTGKVVLDRILSGEYQRAESKLCRKKNKWYAIICYKFEPKEKDVIEGSIMGVDMGIVYPVYMAFNNSLSRYKIEGGEIDRFRKQVESRRIEISRQGKHCGEGRKGHGRNTRLKPLNKISDKIANFRDTVNHKYSKYVVEMAVRHKVETIQMEDLSDIGNLSKFLKNWTYYDLQEKIKYKAEDKGIKVVLIEPAYTSQRCSECGYIDRANRPQQSRFLCQECGFEENADYNAAKNIATKDIDTIIANYNDIPDVI